MIYSWVGFWATFFIGGSFFYNHDNSVVLPNHDVTHAQLHRVIASNAILSFMFIPLANLIPTLVFVPSTWVGYIIRVLLALFIGEAIFYFSHRLLHTPTFYRFHKMHHMFTSPSPLAGVYASPLEYFISNHLSMIIPLKIISCPDPLLLCMESAIVAANILKSHSSIDSVALGSPTHHIHHQYQKHNFGFLYIFDYWFNTLKLKHD